MPEDLNKEQFLIPMLVAKILHTVGATGQLYKELTDQFWWVMFNQFRKDCFLCLCVEKKWHIESKFLLDHKKVLKK